MVYFQIFLFVSCFALYIQIEIILDYLNRYNDVSVKDWKNIFLIHIPQGLDF